MAEEYWGWILDVFYFSNEKYFIFWKNIVRVFEWRIISLVFYFRIFDELGDGFSTCFFIFEYLCTRNILFFWKNIVRDGSWNGGLFRSFYFRMFDGWKVGDGFSRHVLFSNICVREVWGWILDVLRRVKCFEHLCTRNILFLLESWNGELIVVLFSNI